MLEIIPVSSRSWQDMRNLRGECYVASLSHASLRKWCKLIGAGLKKIGLGLSLSQDSQVVALSIEDRAAFIKFQRDKLIPEHVIAWQEHLLSSGHTKINLTDLEAYWQYITKNCLSVCAEYEDRLSHVIIGIGGEPYFNSGAAPIPSGGDFILFNIGMIRTNLTLFLAVWFQLNAEIAESVDKKINQLICRHSAMLLHVACALCGASIIESQNYNALLEFFPEIERLDEVARGNITMIMCFVALHELGHIALGHTAELRKRGFLHSPPKNNAAWIEKRHSFEIESDAFAVQRLMRLCRNPKEAAAAVFQFFVMIGLYESQAVFDINFKLTHPPAIYRLRKALTTLSLDESTGIDEHVIEIMVQLFENHLEIANYLEATRDKPNIKLHRS
jgi:hypothetical protein